ncbi:MAG: sulfite exporter TauE/SafE family protein [Butyricicoccus sp.]
MYLWIIAAVAAYFIKGLCGFANTLVFTSILSFGASNANISPIDLLLGYPTNLILTWKNRKSLDPKVYLPLAALVLAGSIPGALLLKNVDARAIKLVFGVVVAVFGVEMLSREYRKKKVRSSKLVLAIIGVTAGVLCGLFGVGAACRLCQPRDRGWRFVQGKHQRGVYRRQHLPHRSLQRVRASDAGHREVRSVTDSVCAFGAVCGHQMQQPHG